MVSSLSIFTVGIVASVLTSFAFVPQMRRIVKRRASEDVSLGMLGQFGVGLVLWVVYGVFRGDFVIIGANLWGLFLTLITFGLALKYR